MSYKDDEELSGTDIKEDEIDILDSSENLDDPLDDEIIDDDLLIDDEELLIDEEDDDESTDFVGLDGSEY